ncbi:MAG: phosphodiester glycosidase family protein [Chlorogloea purpurea SAG 13.99]|nr:phosphodiester glycosidase family protein [Chlorogloea purpurea SAG 13.99]
MKIWSRGILLLSLLFFNNTIVVLAVPDLAQDASTNRQLLTRGSVVSINGRKLTAAWSQWQNGPDIGIGISDTGARKIFGLDLLNTEQPTIQPIAWYENQSLNTRFISPYRYLDVTRLLQGMGATFSVSNNVLNINYPPAGVQSITTENYGIVGRIIVNLDRPVFWQTVQNRGAGTIILDAITDKALLNKFQSGKPGGNSTGDEDDPGNSQNNAGFSLSLDGNDKTTTLKINLPTGYGGAISSVSNPPRLVIDVRPDPLLDRRIVWQDGVIWQQKYIKLQKDWFPVTWLEIDPRKANLILKPIVPSGTAPLIKTATVNGAIAAINGGYFNRNNQLPLGAIRVDGRWLSGAILGRGAIGWDNKNNWQIGRLMSSETLITSSGERININNLNSAYVGAGLSRYTGDWGKTYTPLSDGEIVVTVDNNRPRSQSRNKQPVIIPDRGYLLVIRNNSNLSQKLAPGSTVRLESSLQPSDFERLPNIIGGGPLLIQGGRIVLDAEREKFSKAFGQQTASRSAIAITPQGKILLVAVHNRVGGKGATLLEWAQILQGMGVKDALNLDGGSSTGIVLGGEMIDRSAVTAANVHNGIGIFLMSSP